jgi:hypothetical protein
MKMENIKQEGVGAKAGAGAERISQLFGLVLVAKLVVD